MALFDYFKPVPAWTTNQVREFLKEKNAEDYNLVDVRQPSEYSREHIPGARLIPMKELADRMDELDPSRPTIIY